MDTRPFDPSTELFDIFFLGPGSYLKLSDLSFAKRLDSSFRRGMLVTRVYSRKIVLCLFSQQLEDRPGGGLGLRWSKLWDLAAR